MSRRRQMHRTMMKRLRLASAAALLAIGAATLSISGAARDAAPGSAGLMVRIAELEIDPAQLDAYKAILAEEQEASVRLEPPLGRTRRQLHEHPAPRGLRQPQRL